MVKGDREVLDLPGNVVLQDQFKTLFIGSISSRRVSEVTEKFKNPSTFVNFVGGAFQGYIPGNRSNELPADGVLAVFDLEARYGKSPTIKAWGWLKMLSHPYGASATLEVDWVKTFEREVRSLGGGMLPPSNGQS